MSRKKKSNKIEIKATIFDDAEAWLRENAEDMATDGISAVYRTSSFRPDGITEYYDDEEDRAKYANMADHVKALELLANQIGKTLFVGMLTSPFELTDPGNWDAEVVDAYFQLIFHGEVIYG